MDYIKMGFIDKYLAAREEKKSLLCIGLDPALPDQRRQDVITKTYPGDDVDITLQLCMEIQFSSQTGKEYFMQ